MKGYTPPPRVTISNEPLPITKNITITEGISVKDLAEKSKDAFALFRLTLDNVDDPEHSRFIYQ